MIRYYKQKCHDKKRSNKFMIGMLPLPRYTPVNEEPTNSPAACCVNPPRHVVSSTFFPQVMLISVCISMLPFKLIILRAYSPTTLTIEPPLNVMSPVNVMTATG